MTLSSSTPIREGFQAHHTTPRLGSCPLFQTDRASAELNYSTKLLKLAPEDMRAWVLREFDRVALAQSVFTPEALNLVVRSGEGVLRRTRNLCVSSLLEAVRDRVRTVDLGQVNRVLLQPHWRQHQDVLDLP